MFVARKQQATHCSSEYDENAIGLSEQEGKKIEGERSYEERQQPIDLLPYLSRAYDTRPRTRVYARVGAQEVNGLGTSRPNFCPCPPREQSPIGTEFVLCVRIFHLEIFMSTNLADDETPRNWWTLYVVPTASGLESFLWRCVWLVILLKLFSLI